MKFHTILVLTLFCFLSTPAQNTQSEAPPTPEILKKVLLLEGKWEAKASMRLGETSYAFPYFMHFRRTADGNGLYMDENATIPDVGTLRGANIIGFDPYEQKLHWFSVDNFGTTHDHVGELVEKDHLRLIHESLREGKTFREEIDVVWHTPEEVHVKLIGTLDGHTEEILEGTFTRKSKK